MNHFIFFHGVGIRSHFWDIIVPKLEERSVEYSLIDLDFSSLDNAFESSIQSVREIMKKYPERNFVLVGHSLGGLFAIYVAQQLGDEIHKLIRDTDFVDELTSRAFMEISLSRKFNYDKLYSKVSNLIINSIKEKKYITEKINLKNSEIKKIKVKPSRPIIYQNTYSFKLLKFIQKYISFILNFLPKEKTLEVKKLSLSIMRKLNII